MFVCIYTMAKKYSKWLKWDTLDNKRQGTQLLEIANPHTRKCEVTKYENKI